MVSEPEYVDWLLREANRRPLDVKERKWIDEYYFKNPAGHRPQVRSHLPKPARVFLVALPALSLLSWLLWGGGNS